MSSHVFAGNTSAPLPRTERVPFSLMSQTIVLGSETAVRVLPLPLRPYKSTLMCGSASATGTIRRFTPAILLLRLADATEELLSTSAFSHFTLLSLVSSLHLGPHNGLNIASV